MNNAVKKNIALALCLVTLTTAALPAAVVRAAEATQEQTTQQKPFLERLAEKRAKEAMEVSKVIPGHAYIPKGTKIQIELTEELSSKRAKVGDAVPLKVVDNIIINDTIVIPAGAEVEGVVTKARKAGGLGRGGKLEFSITGVKTVNNVNIPLNFTKGEHGAGDAGGAAVFAAVSIVGGLFMKGKNVIYNSGMKFDAEVTTDTDLSTTIEDLPTAMNPAKPHGTVINLTKQ